MYAFGIHYSDCRQSPQNEGLVFLRKRSKGIKKDQNKVKLKIIREVRQMLNKRENKVKQVQVICIEDLVPKKHLLRKIDKAIDWSFIELVEDKYCKDNGRPSIDPVTLIKMPILQYLYGIKSMRQTIKEIEVNVAYRWFLGLDLTDEVPHFSTFGKNYKRRFEGTDIFEQIFARILEECIKNKLVKPKEIFVDATHVKACANSKKLSKEAVERNAVL